MVRSFIYATGLLKMAGTGSTLSLYTEGTLTGCCLRYRASLRDRRLAATNCGLLFDVLRTTIYQVPLIAFLRFRNRGKKKYGVFSTRGSSHNLRISVKTYPSQQYLIEFHWFCFMIDKCGDASLLNINL
jgi:hypothetical protein